MAFNLKTALIAGLAALLLLLSFGCKSEEDLPQSGLEQPAALSPDINVTVPAAEEPRTLTVSGSGKSTAAPDTASVYIEITSDDAEAENAQSANAELVIAVTAAITGSGVAEKDIQTENVYLNEVYDYDRSPAVVTGYRMTTTLKVMINDIDITGAVIGNAIAAGATRTYGLSLSVKDSSPAYAEALAAAATDASIKANALASALGLTISELPVSVSESSTSYAPTAYRNDMAVMKEAAADGAEAPISTGELTIDATVSIVYEIISAE